MKRTSPPNFRRKQTPHPGTGKPGAARKAAPDWMDCLDRLHGCCRTVEMLGQLMDGYGNEPLPPEALREAGSLLEEQAGQLRAAVADLEAAR